MFKVMAVGAARELLYMFVCVHRIHRWDQLWMALPCLAESSTGRSRPNLNSAGRRQKLFGQSK
jgi:hypothetical protein